MKVEFTTTASKQFIKLPKNEIKKIAKKLKILEGYPLAGKKLKGHLSDRYSLKAWPYRIFYVINKGGQTIIIDKIEHRQRAYKN